MNESADNLIEEQKCDEVPNFNLAPVINQEESNDLLLTDDAVVIDGGKPSIIKDENF